MDNIVFIAYVFYPMFTKQGKGVMMGGEVLDTANDEITQSSAMLATKLQLITVLSIIKIGITLIRQIFGRHLNRLLKKQ